MVSGWAPGETLENPKKFKFFDWLPRNGLHCLSLPQKSCGNKIPVPRVSPGAHPLTKKPEGLRVRDWLFHDVVVCLCYYIILGEISFRWMCRKRRPKNEDRRPKTLWSKTKTLWSKTKTHWSKTKTHWSHCCSA